MDYTIHWLPIIVVIILNLIIGSFWYSPKNAIGRYWVAHSGARMEPDKEKMKKMFMKSILLQVIVTGVMAWIFNVLMHAAFAMTAGAAMHLAVLLWLGFVIPSYIGIVLWENKPWGLFWLNATNQLINLLVMAVVFSHWG